MAELMAEHSWDASTALEGLMQSVIFTKMYRIFGNPHDFLLLTIGETFDDAEAPQSG